MARVIFSFFLVFLPPVLAAMAQAEAKVTRVVAGKPIFVTNAGVKRTFTLSVASAGALSSLETFRADAVAAVVQVIGAMMNEVQDIATFESCRDVLKDEFRHTHRYNANVGGVTIVGTAEDGKHGMADFVSGAASVVQDNAHKSFRVIECHALRHLGNALVYNLMHCQVDVTGGVRVFGAVNMNAPDDSRITSLCPALSQ